MIKFIYGFCLDLFYEVFGLSEKKTAKEIILEVMMREKRALTPKEIQKITNLNYNTIRGRLQDLKKAGLIVRIEEGWIYKEYVPPGAKIVESKGRGRRKK